MRRFILALSLLLTPAAVQASTLFEQLGGESGLTSITNDFVDTMLADPRIKDSFAESNMPRIRKMLFDQFCELTGGPCKYAGLTMRKSHGPLKLTNMHFNALVEDLQSAMDRANIPFSVQNRFLALLAPLQREIVTR